MPIFDQGYQHWSGQLSGHGWRSLAIARHGVRVGLKGRVLRMVLLAAWLPALALAVTLCLWGLVERKASFVASLSQFLSFFGSKFLDDPRHYRVEIWTLCYSMFFWLQLRLAMILILLVGPSLISQDLRFNALPLYFSRPLRRIDYFVGKLGVIAVFLGRIIILPSLIAYVLGLLFSLDITIIRDTFRILLASLVYGLVITLSAGLLILALSSLSRNSRYIALCWLGIWFVSGIVATLLQETERSQRRQEVYQRTMEIQRKQVAANPAGRSPDDRRRRDRPLMDEQRTAWAKMQADDLRALKTSWRPMVSYVGNLSRIGRQLLGSDRCVESLSRLLPPDVGQQFLVENMGPQYPWGWSAGVLAGLVGISACVLKMNIKSLDRLK
ncbi:MAG: hypothetical protein ACHRHE_18910 [Tepidisphaerales bacterium]